MGPEDPFPAAVNDAWPLPPAAGRRNRPAKLVIGGDSAGGGLTFATALAIKAAACRSRPASTRSAPGPTHPDRRRLRRQGRDRSDDHQAALDDFAAAYLAGGKATNPLASPVFGNLADLARC